MSQQFWNPQIISSQPPSAGGQSSPTSPINFINVVAPISVGQGGIIPLGITIDDPFESITAVNISRSEDGGQTFGSPFAFGVSVSTGFQVLNVPADNPVGTLVVFKVQDADEPHAPQAFGVSNVMEIFSTGPPDPNAVGIDSATTPKPIGAQFNLTGFYTEDTQPIDNLDVYRSNDNGANFFKIVNGHAVTGGAFSIPIIVAAPSSDFVLFKVVVSNDSDTFDVSNVVQISTYVVATTWSITNVNTFNLRPLGGDILVADGDSDEDPGKFPPGTYQFYLGDRGDDKDAVCHSGIAGQGNDVFAKKAESTLECVQPKMNPGTGYLMSAVRNDQEIFVFTTPFTVFLPNFESMRHRIKKLYAPIINTGARGIDSEP